MSYEQLKNRLNSSELELHETKDNYVCFEKIETQIYKMKMNILITIENIYQLEWYLN